MSNDFSAIIAFISLWAVIFIPIMLICLAIAAVLIVAKWKIFEKAGEEGWKSIIPVYNNIVLCQIVGVSPWWILIVYCSSILAAVPFIGQILFSAVTIYYSVILNISLARAFKKDDGFAIGLILLQPVFACILAFGKENKFVEKNPMNDILFNKKTN